MMLLIRSGTKETFVLRKNFFGIVEGVIKVVDKDNGRMIWLIISIDTNDYWR